MLALLVHPVVGSCELSLGDDLLHLRCFWPLDVDEEEYFEVTDSYPVEADIPWHHLGVPVLLQGRHSRLELVPLASGQTRLVIHRSSPLAQTLDLLLRL